MYRENTPTTGKLTYPTQLYLPKMVEAVMNSLKKSLYFILRNCSNVHHEIQIFYSESARLKTPDPDVCPLSPMTRHRLPSLTHFPSIPLVFCSENWIFFLLRTQWWQTIASAHPPGFVAIFEDANKIMDMGINRNLETGYNRMGLLYFQRRYNVWNIN